MKEQILAYLPKRARSIKIPSESIGVLPFMLVSFELGISILIGYIAARFFAGSETNVKGRFPSLTFSIKEYGIHLHHWLLFLGFLLAALIWGFFIVATNIFYGFLGGVIAHGILMYEDWPRVVFRKN